LILEIKNLEKAFGGIVAVKALDFTIDEGNIVGLLGPNGSGKTTTFSLISGYLTKVRSNLVDQILPVSNRIRYASLELPEPFNYPNHFWA